MSAGKFDKSTKQLLNMTGWTLSVHEKLADFVNEGIQETLQLAFFGEDQSGSCELEFYGLYGDENSNPDLLELRVLFQEVPITAPFLLSELVIEVVKYSQSNSNFTNALRIANNLEKLAQYIRSNATEGDK